MAIYRTVSAALVAIQATKGGVNARMNPDGSIFVSNVYPKVWWGAYEGVAGGCNASGFAPANPNAPWFTPNSVIIQNADGSNSRTGDFGNFLTVLSE